LTDASEERSEGEARYEQTATSDCGPARFLQIENKMDVIVEYELAGEIRPAKLNNSLYQFDVSAGLMIRFGDY
jgi:hypothetical protein